MLISHLPVLFPIFFKNFVGKKNVTFQGTLHSPILKLYNDFLQNVEIILNQQTLFNVMVSVDEES